MMAANVGMVTVELMARVGEAEPQSLGFLQLPIVLKSPSVKVLEVQLEGAVAIARAQLEKIFQEEPT